MSIRCKELREDRTKLRDQNTALFDAVGKRDGEQVAKGETATGPTEDENKAFDERQARIVSMTAEIDRRQLVLQQEEEWSQSLGRVGEAAPTGREPVIPTEAEVPKQIVIPAAASRWAGTLRNFHGPDAQKRAYKFGIACLGAIGVPAAIKRCATMGLPLGAATPHKESDMQTGGVFVLEEIDPDMVRLIEQYSVMRRTARVRRMTSDTKKRRRRTGGNTAYFTGEGGAGTHSKATYDWITLVAQDCMALTTLTEDLNEDAAIAVGDELAGELAYAIATKEDDCGFNGDGTSTYGGMTGFLAKIKGLTATFANIAGITVSANNTYPEVARTEFEAVIGNLPVFGDTPQTRWFCHKAFWAAAMVEVAMAAGGTPYSEVAVLPGGGRAHMFLGYPVEFVQIMPKVVANSQVCCLLGDMSLAVDFGDRRQTTIAFSRDASVDSVSMFETNQIAVKATSRFDIVAHDVGNQSATAALRVAGPVVGLMTAAA